MAEGVNSALRIKRGPIRGGKDNAGGADGGADGSGCDDAHAGGTSGLVTCASHNRSADFQTSFRSASGRKFCADLGRFEQARQESLVKFRSLQASWLTTEENPALGEASSCYGDSGGPYLLGDSNLVVATGVNPYLAYGFGLLSLATYAWLVTQERH